MARQDMTAALERFCQQWQAGDPAMKECFMALMQTVRAMDGTSIDFVERPGVSYSLRPRHQAQQDRALFAMIDVIDDDPADRWLSVCFYEDMINDPEARGEVIPGGLAGSDGYCFDVASVDDTTIAYLQARLEDAWRSAAGC